MAYCHETKAAGSATSRQIPWAPPWSCWHRPNLVLVTAGYSFSNIVLAIPATNLLASVRLGPEERKKNILTNVPQNDHQMPLHLFKEVTGALDFLQGANSFPSLSHPKESSEHQNLRCGKNKSSLD
ncbi:hypothetical protein ElyMa_007063400 [Elysia marginata]|uniref:Uncharacterized protein n=1 Tax=Elysia marginata TaxID=1093978 RepID=A0AAV4JYD6_9GAST|nr:hypothetical protein ElyMa_007063400 [Elysia marginata]